MTVVSGMNSELPDCVLLGREPDFYDEYIMSAVLIEHSAKQEPSAG